MTYKNALCNTKARNAKTRRLLKKYTEAVSVTAFKGAYTTEEAIKIVADYNTARKQLLEHIDG